MRLPTTLPTCFTDKKLLRVQKLVPHGNRHRVGFTDKKLLRVQKPAKEN